MIVSGPATHTTHNRRENTIFHGSNPLTTFYNVTSRLPGHNFGPFCSVVPRFETWLLLARLVKVEIVSPYCGILINTGMDNPTVLFTQPLGIGEFKASEEALDIRGPL